MVQRRKIEPRRTRRTRRTAETVIAAKAKQLVGMMRFRYGFALHFFVFFVFFVVRSLPLICPLKGS